VSGVDAQLRRGGIERGDLACLDLDHDHDPSAPGSTGRVGLTPAHGSIVTPDDPILVEIARAWEREASRHSRPDGSHQGLALQVALRILVRPTGKEDIHEQT
jgi:hypothetical protein